MQSNKNGVEIKLNSEDEPITSGSEEKINKKIILLIITILVIIGSGVVYFLLLNKGDNNELLTEGDVKILEDKEIKVEENKINKELDSDQDGLPNHIEEILGTNFDEIDTDGDSYSDFDEIKNGYNPLNDEKLIEEEWEDLKNEIKNKNEGLYEEMFEGSVVNSNNIEADDFVCGNSTVIDIDGNIYKTVEIGNQCWLKENLKVTKSPQGNDIIRYCYNNDENICNTDGGLYDWNTAMNNSIEEGSQGICPDGWHIPKDLEWFVLENYLKDDKNSCDSMRNEDDCDAAGTKLKTGGISGFNGILSGYRSANTNMFNTRGTVTSLWSSTMEGDDRAWQRTLSLSHFMVHRTVNRKIHSCPVRCLKN